MFPSESDPQPKHLKYERQVWATGVSCYPDDSNNKYLWWGFPDQTGDGESFRSTDWRGDQTPWKVWTFRPGTEENSRTLLSQLESDKLNDDHRSCDLPIKLTLISYVEQLWFRSLPVVLSGRGQAHQPIRNAVLSASHEWRQHVSGSASAMHLFVKQLLVIIFFCFQL